MLVLVLAAIQPRPEPDRDGVLKTQSAPAQDRRQNIYRYVQRPRGDMRPLLPAGMLELLQGCRICLRLKVGCFSVGEYPPSRHRGSGYPAGRVAVFFICSIFMSKA